MLNSAGLGFVDKLPAGEVDWLNAFKLVLSSSYWVSGTKKLIHEPAALPRRRDALDMYFNWKYSGTR